MSKIKKAFKGVLLIAFLFSCSRGSDNLFRITGGSVRLLSYAKMDGAISIREYENGDSTLGIGVFLTIETYSKEGNDYGAIDTINYISAFLNSNNGERDITSSLFNDSTFHIMQMPNGFTRPGTSRGVVDQRTEDHYDDLLHASLNYRDLIHFTNQYNDSIRICPFNSLNGTVDALNDEFFFWITDKEIINSIVVDSKISIVIEFNDRTVVLEGEDR